LVAGSNPAAATNKHKSSPTDQGITQIPQAYQHVNGFILADILSGTE
jgi:hypothetical protein